MNAQQQIHRFVARPAAERRCFFLPASDVFRPSAWAGNAWAGSIAPEAEIIGLVTQSLSENPSGPAVSFPRAMYDELQAWVLKTILIIVAVAFVVLLLFGH